MEIKGLTVVVLSTLVLFCLADHETNVIDALLKYKVEGEIIQHQDSPKKISVDTTTNTKLDTINTGGVGIAIPDIEIPSTSYEDLTPNPYSYGDSDTSDSTLNVIGVNLLHLDNTNNDPIIEGKIIKVDPDTMEPILDSKSKQQEIHHSSSEVGTIYTRWGKTSCPTTEGTSLVYDGYAAGSNYNNRGGGANYLCITKEPKYRADSDTNPSQVYVSTLNGAKYLNQYPDRSLQNKNVPCVVCHTSRRSVQLMIPGQFQCPDDSWTEEYNGYLMSGLHGWPHTFSFECVDKNMEAIENSSRYDQIGALFYNVGVKCNYGLPCSLKTEFKEIKPLTCVVCTK